MPCGARRNIGVLRIGFSLNRETAAGCSNEFLLPFLSFLLSPSPRRKATLGHKGLCGGCSIPELLKIGGIYIIDSPLEYAQFHPLEHFNQFVAVHQLDLRCALSARFLDSCIAKS